MLQKLMNKYQKMSAPVKASLWFTICNAVQKGVSLLTTPIFTRLLTTEQYGVYTIYQSWYQIISIFATLNLYYGVFNNGMTKFPEKRRTFVSSMQGLSTTLTLLLFVVYLCFSSFWNKLFDLSSLYMYMIFLELLFVPAFNFWSAYERYDYKYKKLIICTLIIAFGSPLLGIAAVMNTEYKAEARVISYVLVQVCIGLVFYIFNMMKGKKFFHKQYWKFALLFNIPLIPHYLSSMILNQADRIMISNMVGKSEAAIYAVAYNVGTMMTIIITAIQNSFTPYMYKSIKSNNWEGIKKNSKIIISIVGFACISAMSLGPEIIAIFASEAYYDAIWVIPPVSCAIFFKFLYPLFSNIEFFYEKNKFVMFASCIGAVINIILNYVFIPVYGYYAAGYTTLFCYILYAYAHYLCQVKVCKQQGIKEKPFDVSYIIKFSVFILVAMLVVSLLYFTSWLRYIFLGILLIICAKFMLNNKLLLKNNL